MGPLVPVGHQISALQNFISRHLTLQDDGHRHPLRPHKIVIGYLPARGTRHLPRLPLLLKDFRRSCPISEAEGAHWKPRLCLSWILFAPRWNIQPRSFAAHSSMVGPVTRSKGTGRGGTGSSMTTAGR